MSIQRYANKRRPFQNNKLIDKNQHVKLNFNKNTSHDQDVVEKLLKPEIIEKNKKYTKKDYEDTLRERQIVYPKTKQGYKHIIRDREINKNIEDITTEDLIIYRANSYDKDIAKSMHDYNNKNKKLLIIIKKFL
jgi:hypothetical protein